MMITAKDEFDPRGAPIVPNDLFQEEAEWDGVIRCLVAERAAPVRIGDVFDLMRLQCERRGGVFALSAEQVAMGRTYRALVERHEAGGVRCSSVEGIGGGGGDADAYIQARIDASRLLDTLRKRIGDGDAMAVRRVRPSDRGQRLAIRARVLVDEVCLLDTSPTEVLRKHGWYADGKHRDKLIQAIGEALENMMGPKLKGGIKVMRTDLPPLWPLK